MNLFRHIAAIVCLIVWGAASFFAFAEQIPVRHTEGLVHGFLVLRNLDGEILADGDLYQSARNNQVTNHLVFHFKDGSVQDETVVFSQRRQFRLVSDHLIQKGPSFPTQLEVRINGLTGECKVDYTNEKGESKSITEQLKVTTDVVAYGLMPVLLKNVSRDNAPITMSMVAVTPKPRLVKLVITPRGESSFAIAGEKKTATDYAVKVEIGGLAGLVAPLVGKQPPDTHVWILGGEAPAFVRMEGPLYLGGPIWRIDLASPTWPKSEEARNANNGTNEK